MITQSLKHQITLKRVLILAYVLSVLLIAGLSEASELPGIPVTKVQVDEMKQMIFVEGYRANPCQRVPRPEVASVDDNLRKIVMKIVPSVPQTMICAQVIGGDYDVLVNFASLKIPAGVPYEVTFENAADDVRPVQVVSKGMVDAFPYRPTDISGILVKNGNQFTIQTRGPKYKVVPSTLNLEDYAGRVVSVAGHRVQFNLMPVDDISQNQTGDLPLVVTGIASSN
jgi:hypothetical protein